MKVFLILVVAFVVCGCATLKKDAAEFASKIDPAAVVIVVGEMM